MAAENGLQDWPHICIEYEGQDIKCEQCKFKQAALCKAMVDLLSKFNEYMKAHFRFKLKQMDRKDVLSLTFAKIFEKYEPDRGTNLNSYAWPWFKGIMYDYMRQSDRTSHLSYKVANPPNNINNLFNNNDELSGLFIWDSEANTLELRKYPIDLSDVNLALEKADFDTSKAESKDKDEGAQNYESLL